MSSPLLDASQHGDHLKQLILPEAVMTSTVDCLNISEAIDAFDDDGLTDVIGIYKDLPSVTRPAREMDPRSGLDPPRP